MEATRAWPDEVAALRRRMLAVARRRGVTWDDAEDVVQEALLKVARQGERPGAPPLPVRAFVALRDKLAERARSALRHPVATGADRARWEREMAVTEEARLSIVETCHVLAGIVGQDAMTFAVLKAAGATEGDIVELLGWPAQRVAAARVRLGRKRAAIARALSRSFSKEAR